MQFVIFDHLLFSFKFSVVSLTKNKETISIPNVPVTPAAGWELVVQILIATSVKVFCLVCRIRFQSLVTGFQRNYVSILNIIHSINCHTDSSDSP